MINYIKQDITTVHQGVVAHGCNCQGVMGAGVALAIRMTWPKAYNLYTRLCQESKPEDLLGVGQVVQVASQSNPNLYVANLFTQLSYGSDGKQYASSQAIRDSLHEAFEFARQHELDIYMPKIGCGLGGLNWEVDVAPIVQSLSNEYDVDVIVCDLPIPSVTRQQYFTE